MRVGDFVKFDAPNGSTGKIIEVTDDGVFCVEWVYGRDVRGEVMTAVSRRKRPIELVPISEAAYLAVRDHKGFGAT